MSLRLSEHPERDRPRERLWSVGPAALTGQELLAILLGTGYAGRDALAVAGELLARVDGSLRRLAGRPSADLARVAGVGRGKAARVVAALELGRRVGAEEEPPPERIRGPADVQRFYASRLRDLAVEEFHVLALGSQSQVLGDLLITRGIWNSSLVHPREVFRASVAVATILAEQQMDAVTSAAALLHGVVEDSNLSVEDIRTTFGPEVAELVDGLTKLSTRAFRSTVEEQAENYRKLLLSVAKDARVIIIKLADRLHNMRTLEHLDPEKRRRIALETREIYAPLAHRFGMAGVKAELEDLACKFLEPEDYRALARKVKARKSEREETIERLRIPLAEELRAAGLTGSPQLFGERDPQSLDGLFTLALSRLDLARQRAVVLGLEELAGEVLELGLHARHAKAVRQRGIDLAGLERDAAPLFRIQVLQRPHVVQPVGELDDDDAGVLGNGQQELAVVLGLLLHRRPEREGGELREPVHQLRYLGPERGANVLDRDVRVLDHIVQQGGRDGDRVHLLLGENGRDGH